MTITAMYKPLIGLLNFTPYTIALYCTMQDRGTQSPLEMQFEMGLSHFTWVDIDVQAW